jgi:hypothetical protein
MTEVTPAKARAIAAHAEAWRLLDKADRTPVEVPAMIGAAHASLAAWEEAGTFVEAQRGNWLVARCYVEAGLAEPALEFARRTMELTAKHKDGLADFDRAFAKEIAARAWGLAGNRERGAKHYADTKMLGEAIADPGDRAEFFHQFSRGPWFGLDGEKR